jgi:hypothetical protein
MYKILEFLKSVFGALKKLNICITTGGLVGFFAIHMFNMVELSGANNFTNLMIASIVTIAILNWFLVLFIIGLLLGYGIMRIAVWSFIFSLVVSTFDILIFYLLLYPAPSLIFLLAGLVIGILLGMLLCSLCNLLLGIACNAIRSKSR